jgi:hypothetical protein
MSGIDPDTKKYVGPDAVVQKDIAAIENEKLAPDTKKGQIDELQSDLKSPADPVKFPANIDLVVKNYDKQRRIAARPIRPEEGQARTRLRFKRTS